MKQIKFFSLLLVGLLTVCFGALHCTAPRFGSSQVTLIASLDASASNRAHLPASLLEMAEMASSLPSGSHVSLFRIDNRCQEIFNDDAPGFPEDFAARMTPRLEQVAKEDNTYLHLLARSITSILKNSQGQVAIVIDSDFFCEGMTSADHKELATHVSKWAKDSRVACIVAVHANPKRMEQVRADFASAGNKLIVTPDGVSAETVLRFVREASK